MSKKKQSIDDVIAKITEVLAESGELPENVDTDAIRGVQADQLPPYVAEIEDELYETMLTSFEQLHGSVASPEVIDAIRFIARAEAVRRYTYRKLAFDKLDEYLLNR